MTISYKWISEYIPLQIDHEKISKILTSIGLEVESMEYYESIKGGLRGLVVGEVKEVVQHPGAADLLPGQFCLPRRVLLLAADADPALRAP